MPGVSLYIPAYNVEEHIERCVLGVSAQTHQVDEILVIDDGSHDRTVEIAAGLPKVKIIRHQRNRGLAAARNTGLDAACNELVASLDADTCPDPTWLETLVKHLADPQIAAAGGTLIESAIHGPADRWRRNFMTQSWGSEVVHNPKFLCGNNVLIRKTDARQVGGYNPAMRTNGEDVDMSERLRNAGRDTVFDPAAVVRHYRTDTEETILDAQWRWNYFGLRFNVKPPGMFQVGVYSFYFFGVSLWRIAKPRADWCDPAQIALNARFPFYMARRLLGLYLGRETIHATDTEPETCSNCKP